MVLSKIIYLKEVLLCVLNFILYKVQPILSRFFLNMIISPSHGKLPHDITEKVKRRAIRKLIEKFQDSSSVKKERFLRFAKRI